MFKNMRPDNFSARIREGLPKPSRIMSPFQWYGGKGKLAKWIVPNLPRGKVYVEPFAGAASVFWHLPKPYPIEVLNDLDGEIVNLFRVLQDRAKFADLAHRITWTPYALDEFRRALTIDETADDVTRAWAHMVRQNMGFSGLARTEGNWSRTPTLIDRGMAHTASKWRSRMAVLQSWHERLTRVQVDNRDALEVIRYWDDANTVFYLDPPYVHATRKSAGEYKHEMDDAQHERLVDVLIGIKGSALLSGYDSPIYKSLSDNGWVRIERQTACFAAGKFRGSKIRGTGSSLKHAARTEVLWVKRGYEEDLFA